MKELKTLIFNDNQTETQTIESVISECKQMKYAFNAEVENVIDLMSNGEYDLLIVDRGLETETKKKIEKLSGILFPDAAVVNMYFTDEDYIRFKLDQLIKKWEDANSDSQKFFYDDPELNRE